MRQLWSKTVICGINVATTLCFGCRTLRPYQNVATLLCVSLGWLVLFLQISITLSLCLYTLAKCRSYFRATLGLFLFMVIANPYLFLTGNVMGNFRNNSLSLHYQLPCDYNLRISISVYLYTITDSIRSCLIYRPFLERHLLSTVAAWNYNTNRNNV